jgi:hypothetical protein
MNTPQLLSLNRRQFLRTSIGAGVASTIFSASSCAAFATTQPLERKVIIVTFGGGARDDETFSVSGQQNIPHLLNELAPQSCFFTQVLNRGILGHYVATASIATGVYETFDNFIAQAPEHPTIFEYFRKGRRRPREDAWVIAPSTGFTQMGASQDRRYGPDTGAELVLPKQLLAASLGAGRQLSALGDLDLLRDSYETPTTQQFPSVVTEQMKERMFGALKMTPEDVRAAAARLASPDELSVFFAKHVMREFAPSLLFLTLHDIDIAHSGAYSLYLEGIQRTDRLCLELWNEIQKNPEYKDKTTLLILPDFGRDGDEDAGGNGFQHHRAGGALARTTWMMALGPEVRQRTVVDRVIEPVDLVPTVSGMLGFDAPMAQGKRIAELV